jgi:hypothetical protein
MLTSLLALTAALEPTETSNLAQVTADGVIVTPGEYSLYRPQDPSTLTLALIGAATLAVYFGSRRAVRTRRPASIAVTQAAQPESVAAIDVQTGHAGDEPSRGAA